MARPKSEDKKQALLEAATAAFAQSGIAASTALIARNAGVAEGTLFRYFALMNPLMILVKIIKLRWIHILSYDQMVSRKINNQTTR
ncbi:TetR/AcrR family transcriptional regulator, partial [Enterobacter hormaechei]|uniref:TetR/AcrR family transcriptional regulator n=3 Tax=Enterobacter hormaechei TaxID=158836 RepID=UPI0021492FBD